MGEQIVLIIQGSEFSRRKGKQGTLSMGLSTKVRGLGLDLRRNRNQPSEKRAKTRGSYVLNRGTQTTVRQGNQPQRTERVPELPVTSPCGDLPPGEREGGGPERVSEKVRTLNVSLPCSIGEASSPPELRFRVVKVVETWDWSKRGTPLILQP